MRWKPCATSGCPELVAQGTTHCEEHRLERRRDSDRKRAGYRSNYGDPHWRQVRRAKLRIQPTCERCDPPAVATVVHHLDELGLRGPRAYDLTNLEALCKLCHDRETAASMPSGWAVK